MRILLLGICFILCSCPEVGGTDIYDYSIVNSSHKTVTMFLYKNDLRDISSKVTLQHGEKLQKRFEASKPASGLSMWALFNSETSGFTSDIEIIFDNNKKIIYHTCTDYVCNNPRNIFDNTHNDQLVEVYTIVDEDYQNATDCGGSCY